ncbi:O-antigen ligase family protein [Aurantibacter sp.]|uniref:O-antigen ligase family protein n=1 Tax=Aurantibacter sp. TaxID=2807103 RepID=UPI0035C81509
MIRTILLKMVMIILIIYPWNGFQFIFTLGGLSIIRIMSFVIIILGLCFGYFAYGFKQYKKTFFLFLFFFFSLLGSLTYDRPNFPEYFKILGFAIFMIVLVGLKPQVKELRKWIIFSSYSFGLMLLVSLTDFLGFISVTNFNESLSSVGRGDIRIFDLVGPFPTRSYLGGVISFYFPIPLLLIVNKTKYRLIHILILILIFPVILFAHSRGLVLSLGITFLLLSILYRRTFAIYVLLFIILIFISFNYISPLFDDLNFIRLFSLNRGSANIQDRIRLYAFIETIKEILVNPFGCGFSTVYIPKAYDYYSPHNNITYILRSGGFFGFLMFLIFVFKILKRELKIFLKTKIITEKTFFLFIILSSSFYGLTHLTINFLPFWISIGVMILAFRNKINIII